jgi:hypothetical protein
VNQLSPKELCKQFIGWQCRVRQYAVRKNEGIPSTGMRPDLEIDGERFGPVTIQIVKSDSEDVTREFRFIVQKTQEHQSRYESGLKLLSEYYYQIPAEFDEEMTAVYSVHSEFAKRIVEAGSCMLEFDQGNQRYQLNCKTRFIEPGEQKYQATYWHNSLFNASMPGVVSIIGFAPDWSSSLFTTTVQ